MSWKSISSCLCCKVKRFTLVGHVDLWTAGFIHGSLSVALLWSQRAQRMTKNMTLRILTTEARRTWRFTEKTTSCTSCLRCALLDLFTQANRTFSPVVIISKLYDHRKNYQQFIAVPFVISLTILCLRCPFKWEDFFRFCIEDVREIWKNSAP